jgi:hypothetical protein
MGAGICRAVSAVSAIATPSTIPILALSAWLWETFRALIQLLMQLPVLPTTIRYRPRLRFDVDVRQMVP